MSAIPSEARLESEVEREETRKRALPVRAQIYWIAIAILAAAVSLPFALRLREGTHHWGCLRDPRRS